MSGTRGLYGKFQMQRVDSRDASGEKHDGCEFFVLDLTHDPYAIPVVEAYADACEEAYPVLAADLRERVRLSREYRMERGRA